MSYSKEEIKTKLSTDVRWMERGVIVLYNRQTEDEKQEGVTTVYNSIGFNGTDSRYLSWVGEWLLKSPYNHLNEKHRLKVGRMLPKYWRQIQEIIVSKQ